MAKTPNDVITPEPCPTDPCRVHFGKPDTCTDPEKCVAVYDNCIQYRLGIGQGWSEPICGAEPFELCKVENAAGEMVDADPVTIEPGTTEIVTKDNQCGLLPKYPELTFTQEGNQTCLSGPGLPPDGLCWEDTDTDTNTDTQLTAQQVCEYVDSECKPFSPVFGQCSWLVDEGDNSFSVPNPNIQYTNKAVAFAVPEFIDLTDAQVGVWTDVISEEACITIRDSPCCNMVHFVHLLGSSVEYEVGDGWLVQVSGVRSVDGGPWTPTIRPALINTIDCECFAGEKVLPYEIFPHGLNSGDGNVEYCLKIAVRVVIKGEGELKISQTNFRANSWGSCVGIY